MTTTPCDCEPFSRKFCAEAQRLYQTLLDAAEIASETGEFGLFDQRQSAWVTHREAALAASRAARRAGHALTDEEAAKQ